MGSIDKAKMKCSTCRHLIEGLCENPDLENLFKGNWGHPEKVAWAKGCVIWEEKQCVSSESGE